MSQKNAPALHIEWVPGRVQVVDSTTGSRTAGETLGELRSLLSRHRDVVVGIGRSAVFLRTLRLPKAAPEDLRRLLMVRMEQLFPLPADQLAFDFIQTADQNGEGFLTLVAAVRAADLRLLQTELQQVGLRAARILPVALGAVPLVEQQHVPEAVVVSRATGGLGLDVVRGGVVLLSRQVSMGADTEREVQRTLAAAGLDSVPRIQALANRGDETQEGETPLRLLHLAPPFVFELAEERVRLQRQRIANRTRLGALLALSAALLATLVWLDYSDAAAKVHKNEGTWARELRKLRSIRDTENRAAQKASLIRGTLKQAFETAQPLSDLLTVVGDSLPPSAWLTGMTIERGKPLQIRGTATQSGDVARLVSALGESKRFRDVKLVFANSSKIDETPVVQFSVTAVAVGNLPAPTPPKKSSKKAPSRTKTAGKAATQ